MGSRGALNFDLTVSLRDGRPSFGQLGVAAGQSRHHFGACAGVAGVARRQGAGARSLVPARDPELGTGRAGRLPDRGRRRRADHRRLVGRARPDRGPRRCSAGTPSRCWRSAPAIPRTRSTRSRRAPRRIARSATPSTTDPFTFIATIRRHLDAHGFSMSRSGQAEKSFFRATRLDPDNEWVQWAGALDRAHHRARPAILPNLGGSLAQRLLRRHARPADDLGAGIPTPAAPSTPPTSTRLAPILREGLQIMTGLFWDLGRNASAASRSVSEAERRNATRRHPRA